MPSLSYLDLHRDISSDVDAEIEAALEHLGPPSNTLRKAVAELVRNRKFKHPLSVLPLLVHAVETGTTAPAVPLSAVHVLWWTSACYLDDLADGDGAAAVAGDLNEHEALLAAVVGGNALPLHVLRSPRIPAPAQDALVAEVATCWTGAVEGQLRDMRADVDTASRESVVATYRGKSGAPFGMITAMAAKLAGAERRQSELWREFGHVYGVLWQIFNDQDDILTERHEDLRNGTVTYLLACALEELPRSRERVLGLHAASRTSARARRDLTKLLLAPVVLHRYHKDITAFRDEAYRILGALGGDGASSTVLRQLVDLSAQMLLREDRAQEVGSARPPANTSPA